LRLPYSIAESIIWSSIVYYVIGFAYEPGRWGSVLSPLPQVVWSSLVWT
jgi:hypothetical protein